MRGVPSAAGKATSIRLNTKLADEAVAPDGSQIAHGSHPRALEEAVQLRRFKKFLKKYGGKGEFANSDE